MKKFAVLFTLMAFVISLMPSIAVAEGTIDWSKGIIRATGLATGKRDETNPGLRRAQARRAARIDALRVLAEAVGGVKVTSESSMRDLCLQYDDVRVATEALISNMQEVGEPKFNDDGTCEVTLEMNIYGSRNALSSVAFMPFKNESKTPFPEPSNSKNKNKVAAATTNKYTGLIVDCKNLNLQPCMSPVIKNDSGDPIYGYKNLDYDKVITYGMASYAYDKSEEAATSRAGNNPMIVKAVKVENHLSYPVVTISDSDSILIANQGSHFLENCSVVFIR